jgi:hypothetical protein
MAIKYFGPNDKQGVFWPPYTAAEKRQMDAIDCRKPHSGSYVVVYPYPRGEGRRVQSLSSLMFQR